MSTRSPSPFVTVETTSLLKLLQMLGPLGCGLPLVGAKEKARLEYFVGDPPIPTLASWTSFSWACVLEGGPRRMCCALAAYIFILLE